MVTPDGIGDVGTCLTCGHPVPQGPAVSFVDDAGLVGLRHLGCEDPDGLADAVVAQEGLFVNAPNDLLAQVMEPGPNSNRD